MTTPDARLWRAPKQLNGTAVHALEAAKALKLPQIPPDSHTGDADALSELGGVQTAPQSKLFEYEFMSSMGKHQLSS